MAINAWSGFFVALLQRYAMRRISKLLDLHGMAWSTNAWNVEPIGRRFWVLRRENLMSSVAGFALGYWPVNTFLKTGFLMAALALDRLHGSRVRHRRGIQAAVTDGAWKWSMNRSFYAFAVDIQRNGLSLPLNSEGAIAVASQTDLRRLT
jgi:hypothetical protein